MNRFVALMATGAATVGVLIAPSMAQAQPSDDVNIQDSQQTSIQTGNGNLSNQESRQSHFQSREETGGSTGNVQRSDQLSDQLGNGNVSNQENVQENYNIRRDGSPRRF